MGIETATRDRPSIWNLFSGKKASDQKNTSQNDQDAQEEKPFVNHGIGHALAAILAASALPGAFAKQAEHVSKDGVKHLKFFDKSMDGVLSFISNLVGMVANPVLKRLDKGVVAEQDRTGFKGFLQKSFNLKFAEHMAKALFTYENVFSNMLLGFKDKKSGTSLDIFTSLLKPFTYLTSAFGSLFSLPGDLSASYSSYTGKKDLYHASNATTKAADAFNPVATNLGSLYKTVIAMKNSLIDKKSFKQSREELGLDRSHVLQGVIGGALALPSIPAIISNARTMINKQRDNLAPAIATVAVEAFQQLQKIGHTFNISSLKNIQVHEKANNLTNSAVNFGSKVESMFNNVLRGIVNQPILKSLIFKHFMSVDLDGNLMMSRDEAVESGQDKAQENLLFGFLPKSQLGNEMFKLLNPIQSSLMLLPSAVTSLDDDEIQNHGIFPLRMADKLVGLASGILALPGYAIYLMSSRVPQMITYMYDFKQRREFSRGNYDYNAMDDVRKLVDTLLTHNIISKIPGAKFIAKTLYSDLINNPHGQDLFLDTEKLNSYTLEIAEEHAREQEVAIKMPILLKHFRNGMRMLINNKYTSKIFKASVDENNMTPAQKGKDKIHKFLTKVEHIAAAFPVVGGPISVIFRGLKKPFEIRRVKSAKTAATTPEPEKKDETAKTGAQALTDILKNEVLG